MASPNITELATTTIANYSGTLADNISENIALLWRLEEQGTIKTENGGSTIRQELMYAENGASGFYTGYELLSVSEQDVLSAADFDRKQYYVNVVMSGSEMLANSGSRESMHNLLKARTKVAKLTAYNDINTSLFSAGTGSGGKEIGGLQHIVADTATSGTVGGINRATAGNEFWRNKVYDFSLNSTTASATTIQTAMNTLWLNLVRGKDQPDFMVADTTYYGFYLKSLQANQRFTNDKMAQAGFANLKFMNADMTFDQACPSAHLYMLNTKYLHYRPSKTRNFVVDETRVPVNQDAIVVPLFWAGNLTASNCALQGVMHA